MTLNLTLESSAGEIADYLLAHQLIDEQPKSTQLSKPGEGNMNMVVRFAYDGQSLILKQSKTFVNKFPSIPAPQERIATEAKFYQYAQSIEKLQLPMPRLLHYDEANHLIVMEDLGKSKDLSFIYQPTERLADHTFVTLLQYLNALHGQEWSETDYHSFPDNLKLRQLNHQHIFVLPFQSDNGFELNNIQLGLEAVAATYIKDKQLKKTIHTLGERYLSEGKHLLHGDYYPGSWMRTPTGIKVIDPEFSFMGEVEFELGVFLAHLLLAGHEEKEIQTFIKENYEVEYNQQLTRQFAGIEIMRRLIGIAQLPLNHSLETIKEQMAMARAMVVENSKSRL